MTETSTRTESTEFADPCETFDLIVLHRDRIVFHDHYDDPQQRLRMCVSLLTQSDVLPSGTIDSLLAAQILCVANARIADWSTEPDTVLNAVSKLCRSEGVNIYVSTTRKKTAAPAVLYSVVTEYGSGQTIAEHFPTREARRCSLIERADNFFAAAGCIPDLVLADEQRLAALVGTFIMPATVLLTESVLKASGHYEPLGRQLPIL